MAVSAAARPLPRYTFDPSKRFHSRRGPERKTRFRRLPDETAPTGGGYPQLPQVPQDTGPSFKICSVAGAVGGGYPMDKAGGLWHSHARNSTGRGRTATCTWTGSWSATASCSVATGPGIAITNARIRAVNAPFVPHPPPDARPDR